MLCLYVLLVNLCVHASSCFCAHVENVIQGLREISVHADLDRISRLMQRLRCLDELHCTMTSCNGSSIP